MRKLITLLFLVLLSSAYSQTLEECRQKMIESKGTAEFEKWGKTGLDIAKQQNSPESEGYFAFELGKSLITKNPANALSYAELSVQKFESLNNRQNTKLALQLLFDVQKKINKNDEAISTGQKLINYSKESEKCDVEIEISLIKLNSGNLKGAIDYLNNSKTNCSISQEIKKQEILGVAYNNYGDHKKAIELFTKGRSLAEENNNQKAIEKFNNLINDSKNNDNIKNDAITKYELDEKKDKESHIQALELNTKNLFSRIDKLSKDLQIKELKYLYLEQLYEKNKLEDSIKIQKKDYQLKLKDELSQKQKSEIALAKEKIKFNNFMITFLVVSIILVALIAFVIYRSNKKQKLFNKELSKRNDEVNRQKTKIEYQKRKLDASIHYGGFIQQKLLPSVQDFKSLFKEQFVVHIPLDEVSGDFLWYKELNSKKYICLIDCTGHGVPGAILSIIVNEVFEKSVNEGFSSINELLSNVSKYFYESFQTNGVIGNDSGTEEGMDLCLVEIDEKEKRLNVVSANNAAFLSTSDGNITEIRTSRSTISANSPKLNTTEQGISYSPEDILYLFTDGIYDQIGGLQKRKFGKRNFITSLEKLDFSKFETHEKAIIQQFHDWKENNEQTDDIFIVGIRLV